MYIEIKKIQGSVEVTSINQVEDINSYGAYTIHCDEHKKLISIENAVSLKISRIKAAKKDYSFNDLRDLESKLALIRGRSTKGAAEMDRFLDVSYILVMHISYIVIVKPCIHKAMGRPMPGLLKLLLFGKSCWLKITLYYCM